MFQSEIRERATRIVQGAGCIERLPGLVREFGRRAVLVTDPGIVGAGHVDPVKEALQLQRIEVTVYDQSHENPTAEDVQACVDAVRGAGAEVVIGFGGGSSMDTAKGANFLLTNGGAMIDYKGHRKNEVDLLPLIAVPTTTGTGSEAQRFAVISDPVNHMKYACGDPTCAARVAVLDPQLVRTQPRRVVALTGIDALSHAVETQVTRVRNPISIMHSRAAWDLIDVHLPALLQGHATDHDWEGMQWASCLAGMAIETSMLGAAHAAANPLTAAFDIPHGQAVGILLPEVMRFNGEEAARIRRVEELLDMSGLGRPLSELGLIEDRVPDLANQATLQWTGQFNPRKVGAADFEAIYRARL